MALRATQHAPAERSAAAAPLAAHRPLGWLGQVSAILRKDLAVELATGEILTTAGFFAVLVVVVASLAFYSGANVTQNVAPGVIWVSVSFASVLALSRTWQRERENDAISGLLAMPVARSAIFAGKAIGVLVFVTAIELVVLPASALFLHVPLDEHAGGLALLCLAASPGIAATGTLFGAMTVRTEARDLVLASVLFPLLTPTLLAAVAGTRHLFGGAPLAELTDYLAMMVVFAVVFTAGGIGLFGLLIEP